MSAARRAQEIMRRLPDGELVGAEIGVWKGKLSFCLLSNPNIRLYMVDHWDEVRGYENGIFSKENQEKNKKTAELNTLYAAERRTIMHMTSAEAVKLINEPLDFVYIDADHSYDGVKADIELWLRTIKPGGLICGHDYNNPMEAKTKEVVQAVDEAVARYGWSLETTDNHNWFAKVFE